MDENQNQVPVNQNQVPVEPSPKEQGSNNKAIAALVLGILSILLCFISVFGIILGILAIVFAALSRKECGRSGMATGGLVTGIVGVALNVLFTILFVVVIGFFLNSFGEALDDGTIDDLLENSVEEVLESEGVDPNLFSGSSDGEYNGGSYDGEGEYHHGVRGYTGDLNTQDEKDAYQVAESALENVADPSDTTIEALGTYFDELFKEGAGVSMTDCGIDPNDFASWVVSDAKCDVNDVEVSNDIAYVYYTTRVHDADDLLERASQGMQEYSDSQEFSSDSMENRKEKIGEIFSNAMTDEPQTALGGGVVILEKFNGTWALTSNSQDMLPNDFYNVNWSL